MFNSRQLIALFREFVVGQILEFFLSFYQIASLILGEIGRGQPREVIFCSWADYLNK